MLQNSLEAIDGLQMRFTLQIISFVMTLVATQMVWWEYHRNRSEFLKYLAIGFAVIFIQSGFMLAVFLITLAAGGNLPESLMPIIDHTLKIAGFILLAYAFVVVSPRKSRQARKILNFNLWGLLLLTPVAWYLWNRYLLQALEGRGRFGYFWLDPFYELWATLLLLYCLNFVIKSSLKVKWIFVLAFIVLICKETLHIGNILLANNTIPSILLVERLLIVCFSYVIILAIHQEIIGEVRRVNNEKELLDLKLYDSTINALVGSLEIKDPYTKGHAKRVTDYAMQIGRRLNFSEEALRNLYFGAILHDIGKIGTDQYVLNKNGFLSGEEVRVIKRHTQDGTALIQGIDNLCHIVPTILYHHERWDGHGYPEGLKGENIPLDARIVAVADAYDAMTTDRSYRAAIGADEVMRELKNGRGNQFDPYIVDEFILLLVEAEDGQPILQFSL